MDEQGLRAAYRRIAEGVMDAAEMRESERDVMRLLDLETDWHCLARALPAADAASHLTVMARANAIRARRAVSALSDDEYAAVKLRYAAAHPAEAASAG